MSDPIWGSRSFFYGFYLYYWLGNIPSYHPMKFPGKLMNQTSKNVEKPNFGPDFGPVGPNLGSQRVFFVGFTSTSNYILFQAISSNKI